MAISDKLKRELSGNNPRIKLDLADLFGRFPKQGDSLKEAIGSAMIDKIRDRAQAGDFLEESAGAQSYSPEYRSSREFRVFGKSPRKVNLTASGDMLREIDITKRTRNGIEIGWPGDDGLEAAKAHGHITGNVGEKRDFFGLTDDELDDIRSEFQSDVERQLALEKGKTERAAEVSGAATLALMDRVRRQLGQIQTSDRARRAGQGTGQGSIIAGQNRREGEDLLAFLRRVIRDNGQG